MYGQAPPNRNLRSWKQFQHQRELYSNPEAQPDELSAPRPLMLGSRVQVGFVWLPRFQAEVEAKRLSRKEQPIVVHYRGRIVSLCERAEAAGLRIGMRLSQAHALLLSGNSTEPRGYTADQGDEKSAATEQRRPTVEFITFVEERYRPFWEEVLDLCVAHLGSVEPCQPGEVFVNLTGLTHPDEALVNLQQAIVEKTGFTCLTAWGPSKLVARLGVTSPIDLTDLSRSLDPLPITRLWPLNAKTIEHLQALGITTIGLLRRIDTVRLAEHFGREARRLQDLARGLDHSPVKPLYPPREIIMQQTLPDGSNDLEALERCLQELVRQTARELRRRQESCGRVSMRVMTEDGKEATVSLRLRDPSNDEHVLTRVGRALLERLSVTTPIVNLFFRASECRRSQSRQFNLFYDNRPLSRKRQRTSHALEIIRECFGNDIVILGAEIERPRRERMLAALAGG